MIDEGDGTILSYPYQPADRTTTATKPETETETVIAGARKTTG